MIPQQKGLKLFESGKFKRSVLLRGLHAHLSQKDIEKKVNLKELSHDTTFFFFNSANLILIL